MEDGKTVEGEEEKSLDDGCWEEGLLIGIDCEAGMGARLDVALGSTASCSPSDKSVDVSSDEDLLLAEAEAFKRGERTEWIVV